MGCGPNNPRNRAALETGPAVGSAERRRGADRRGAASAHDHVGADRRQGPRRLLDLPRPVWQRPLAVGLAIGLGIAAGLALTTMRPQAQVVAEQVIEIRVDPGMLAAVQAIRDEAEALTPAGVALDERAHELWMPRVAKIELALADPDTPPSIRDELAATVTALEHVGVLGPE